MKMVNISESIIGHSVIMCDEIIEVMKTVSTKIVPTKTIPTYFNGKKETCYSSFY